MISTVKLLSLEEVYDPIELIISIPLLDGCEKAYRVKLYDIGKCKNIFPNQLKGSNKPTLNDIQRCVVFEGKKRL